MGTWTLTEALIAISFGMCQCRAQPQTVGRSSSSAEPGLEGLGLSGLLGGSGDLVSR